MPPSLEVAIRNLPRAKSACRAVTADRNDRGTFAMAAIGG